MHYIASTCEENATITKAPQLLLLLALFDCSGIIVSVDLFKKKKALYEAVF